MPEVPDEGAAHVASVMFPSRFLKQRPPLKLNKPVHWEPAPEQGALEVGLFYGGRLVVPGAGFTFVTRLSDGRVVMVRVRNTEFDEKTVLGRLSGNLSLHPLSAEAQNLQPGHVIAGCAALGWSDVRDGQAVRIWEFFTDMSVRRN